MNNYINYDWYRNNSYMNNNQMNNKKSELYNPREGFEKGNMFENLYNQYKNYQPAKLTPTNEREKKLYELSAIGFAAHELNLYLDLHPEDRSMFMLFNDYTRQYNRLVEEYERMYGPLNINTEEMNQSFTWESDKWPWEGRNV